MKNQFNNINNSAYLQQGNQQYNNTGNEIQYRNIVEYANLAFFLNSQDGTIIQSNQAATDLFGYSSEEFRLIKKKEIFDYTDPLFQKALLYREKNGFTVSEATGIKKNGIKFPIEIASTTIIDHTGSVKYSTLVSDISQRKKTEANLQLSNERYNLVVKATKDLVWDWDLVTGEIYRNGYSLPEVYGHNSNEFIKNINDWSELIHPQDKEKIMSQLDNFIHSKDEKDFSLEYRFRREDGSYIYINDKGYIIRNTDGKAIRMIGAAEDITERKQTAMAIEESEMRYKMFVQQSTEGIWRIELKEAMHINTPVEQMIEYCYHNAYIAECNDNFARIYGFENAEKIIGSPLSIILPAENPLNRSYILNFFKNGFKAHEQLSYELDENGNQLILLNNMVGIIEGDYIKRAWGTQRNITGQKKAERDLIDRENHLKAIVNAAPECIKVLDKKGNILEMNPAGLQMIGAANAADVIGKNTLHLVSPECHEEFKKVLADVYAGKPAKQEYEIIGFNNRRLFMESHCVPLKNAAGEITSVLAVTRDITESKNAQAQLLASEERYRYLFNNNPASIIIWDIDSFEILEANETAVELYGYSRDEFLNLRVTGLYADDDQEAFISFAKNTRRFDIKKDSGNWKHIIKNGTTIIMEIASHLITYKGKNAVLALGNNITEKAQLENSLNVEREIRQQQITEAVITGQEKERTELGEELHDNINQILASTKLYIECALKDNKPRKDLIEESKILIEKAMAEIRNLSKSLLPPSLGEIGLQQALHELVENIRQVNNLSIHFHWKINDENKIDTKLKLTIFRIVQEQLNNIIKHADAKNVHMRFDMDEVNISISIKDDGLGFNTALKRNGVGLRNISSRAGVNHGIVSIKSSPGDGCELQVTFVKKPLLQKTIMDM